MNIEDIAKDMARDGYNLKDDGANNRALKEYLQTQAGLKDYKEWITSMLEAQYNSEDVEEALKSCTMADWLDDMLNTPDDPLARDILDGWRDKEIAAWTRILARQGQGSSRRPRRQVLLGAIEKPGDTVCDEQR